jgi:hypothetical protein
MSNEAVDGNSTTKHHKKHLKHKRNEESDTSKNHRNRTDEHDEKKKMKKMKKHNETKAAVEMTPSSQQETPNGDPAAAASSVGSVFVHKPSPNYSVDVVCDPTRIVLKLLQVPYPKLTELLFTRVFLIGTAKFETHEDGARAIALGEQKVMGFAVSMVPIAKGKGFEGDAFLRLKTRDLLRDYVVSHLSMKEGVTNMTKLKESGFKLTISNAALAAELSHRRHVEILGMKLPIYAQPSQTHATQ